MNIKCYYTRSHSSILHFSILYIFLFLFSSISTFFSHDKPRILWCNERSEWFIQLLFIWLYGIFCPFFSLQASQLAIILCPTQALFFYYYYFLHPSSIVSVGPVGQVRVRLRNSGRRTQSESRPLPDPWWQRKNPSQHLKSLQGPVPGDY